MAAEAHISPGAVPPAALTGMAAAASARRVDTVSLVRETLDGMPIGWILRFGSVSRDGPLMTVFAGSDDNDLRCYLNGDRIPTPQADEWISGLAAAPADEEILDLFSRALANGWAASLEREDRSFHTRQIPDLLCLRAEAHDYEGGFLRPSETVHVSRHEGETDFAFIGRSDPSGGLRPLPLSIAEATVLLGSPAPMTTDTFVYDEDTEDFIQPHPKEDS